MRRRVLLYLTLITMSACNGDNVVKPTASPTPPSNDISDATHSGLRLASNPDFFFLPPMVKDPSGSPLWNAGAFNASLQPTVAICPLVAADTAAATAASCSGTTTLLNATVDAAAEQYRVNWKVPNSPTTFYRITVRVGTKDLGFADVETGSNGSQLKNVATNDFITLVDGSTLPIKFRIERFALCENPIAGGCSSASGDIATAPITVSTGTPNRSGISDVVGVTIPRQTTVTLPTPVTVTVSTCPSLTSVLDLPVFGECTRITTDPVLPRLADPATVFICAVGVKAPLFSGLSESQEERVTLHRYDASGDHAGLVALPHARACTVGQPGGVASIKPSVGAMLAKLAHGEFKGAASEAVALLTPTPLYAAMFIDLGGGGLTDAFSDFQFALPAKMETVGGTSGQFAFPGSVLSPTVLVTDLGGEPVVGARVHFFTDDPGGRSPGILVPTDADGRATAPWTIGAGSNSIPVSGRGIASPGLNGPRRSLGSEIDDVNDPFQPMQSHFDPNFDGVLQGVSVGTGVVTFTATGSGPADIIVFNDLEMFDSFAMEDGNNQKMMYNLGSFTGTGPRASGGSYIMDGGHGSNFPQCLSDAARGFIGLKAAPAVAPSKAGVPADVKLYVLCLPAAEITPDEIVMFRQFAAEGGRIVFVGENTAAYGGNIPVQNKFLSDMGSSMVITSAMVDCGPYQHHPVDAAAHQVLTGMEYVLLACSSVISQFGPNDITLFSGVGEGGLPLAGVARIGVPQPQRALARAAAAPVPTAPWVPTGGTNGNYSAP